MVAVLVAAGCGATTSTPPPTGNPGASGSPTPGAIPSLANVTLSEDHVATAVIGPAGGSIKATGPDGTVYALTIPKAAVVRPTELAIVPITAVKDLPAGVTLAAGVHLLPEGMQFVQPVSLDIQVQPAAGARLTAFAYGGDLVERHRYPAHLGDAALTLTITHFSGYAALQATEMGAILPWFPEPTGAGAAALNSLMAILDAGDAAAHQEQIANILRLWLEVTIRNDVEAVTASEFQMAWLQESDNAVNRATANLKAYRLASAHLALDFALGFPELDEVFRTLTVQLYEHLFDATNRACAAYPDQAYALLVLEMAAWRSDAEWMVTPSLLPESLSSARFERDVCTRAAFDPAGGADFPTELLAGQTGSLRVRAGYTLPGLAPRFDVPMLFLVQGTNADPAATTITTEPGLSGTSDFTWAPGTDRFALSIDACLSELADLGLLVCDHRLVERGLVAPPPSCPTFTATAGSEVVHSTPQTGWHSISASYSPSEGFAGAAIGGNLTTSLGVAGSSASVRGEATFVVDSVSAGPGSQQIGLNWVGGAFWRGSDQTGAATVVISLTVNGVTYAPEIRVPTADRGIVISADLEVDHNDVIEVSFAASASHGDTTHDLDVTGSLEFVTPPHVSILQAECDTEE